MSHLKEILDPHMTAHKKVWIVLLEIDFQTLHYHIVTHIPIWGYEIISANNYSYDLLEQISVLCRREDVFEKEEVKLLLQVGKLGDIDLHQYFASIVHTFKESTRLAEIPSNFMILLFSSELIAALDNHSQHILENQLTEILNEAKFLGISRSVLLDTKHLGDDLSATKVDFPAMLEIMTVNLNGTDLELELLPLSMLPETLNQSTGSPSYSGRAKLYKPPNENDITILVRSAEKWLRDVICYRGIVNTSDNTVTVEARIEYPDLYPSISVLNAIAGGNVEQEVPCTSTSPENVMLPKLERVIQKHHIVFLIDASAIDDQLRTFVKDIVYQIREIDTIFVFGFVLYNDAEPVVKFPLDATELETIATYLQNTIINERQFSLALERALQVLNKRQFLVSNDTTIVLVGSSPPHPTASELREFELIETPTDLLSNIQWENELYTLKHQYSQSGKSLNCFSVWEPPAFSIDDNQQRFAEYVWQLIGETGYFQGFTANTMNVIVKALSLRHNKEQIIYRLSSNIGYPLQHSLDSFVI